VEAKTNVSSVRSSRRERIEAVIRDSPAATTSASAAAISSADFTSTSATERTREESQRTDLVASNERRTRKLTSLINIHTLSSYFLLDHRILHLEMEVIQQRHHRPDEELLLLRLLLRQPDVLPNQTVVRSPSQLSRDPPRRQDRLVDEMMIALLARTGDEVTDEREEDVRQR